MNKRLRRILEPGFRLQFFVMICFVVASYFFNPYLSAGSALVTLILYIYVKLINRKRQKDIGKYIETLTGHIDTVSQDSMLSAPIPMAVIRLDNNEIIWANDLFHNMTGKNDTLFEVNICDLIPGFDSRWVMEGKTESPDPVKIAGRVFKVYGNMISSPNDNNTDTILATYYWIESTELINLQKKYDDSRIVIAELVVDNLDEIFKNASYPQQSSMMAAVDDRITLWTKPANGVVSRYEEGHYLFVFEGQYLQRYIDTKFQLLDSVREITSPDGIHVTMSIGLSIGSGSLMDNFKQSSLAIDMALSRGGDQAVIKDDKGFSFYGGKSQEMEKRTKVKSRVMANTLSELISDASNVLIMGHKTPDLDAIGAAIGVACAARKKDKEYRIVCDLKNTSAGPLIERMQKLPEYQNAFISYQDALLYIDSSTLLVVVDVSRPEYTEDPELLDTCRTIAVIDHHRRAATYIDHAQLNFHEPYASSASELVTELLQYIVDDGDILNAEAEGLLSGIVLDTKNFTLRTGVRTFEAAAFLRRNGADTIDIKRIFQNDLQDTINRYTIIREAKLYKKDIVVATMKDVCDRVVASQAADELLSVKGVQASFVLYPDGDTVYISARSLGTVNVQVILEKLGGGGHMIQAGAQVRDAGIGEVRARLLQAIDQYVADNPYK